MSSAEFRGRFVWHELMTTDTAAAGEFYPRVLAGWKSQPWEHDSNYTLWVSREGPLGGLMRTPEAATPSQWMPYLSTEDVEATIEASTVRLAEKLPTQIPGHNRGPASSSAATAMPDGGQTGLA